MTVNDMDISSEESEFQSGTRIFRVPVWNYDPEIQMLLPNNRLYFSLTIQVQYIFAEI